MDWEMGLRFNCLVLKDTFKDMSIAFSGFGSIV